MAAKVEWTANDYAAQEILAKMVAESGLSLRAVAQRTDGIASHTRIGDIINGAKGPIRLSEFIAICTACGKDADDVLQQVLDRAEELDQPTASRSPIPAGFASWDPDQQADYIATHPDDFDLAAKYGDTIAEQEAYEQLP